MTVNERLGEVLIMVGKLSGQSRLRMSLIALTLWTGLANGTANATALTFNGWTSNGTGGYSTYFGNFVTTTFSDWLNFTVPSGSSGNGASNLISLSTDGLTITKFELWDGLTLIGFGSTEDTSTSLNFASLNFSGGTVPGDYKLLVEGTLVSGVGAYAGNIVISPVSPVPEPETIAMMLAGLGLIGLSARRRKSDIFD